jgi:hypothetical protein
MPEKDSLWAEEIAKVTDMAGQVGQFTEHPIKDWAMLQAVKCQYSQVSGTCGRDKRDSLNPDGTT